ncbi:DNA repair protein rhp26, partial [Coemansia erecta]
MSNPQPTDELSGLSQLGAQIVDQSVLEHTVHSQAAHNLAAHQASVDRKRLARLSNTLFKKRGQLAKAQDLVDRSKTQSTRYHSALDKIEQLEDEIAQLQRDHDEIADSLEREQIAEQGPIEVQEPTVKQELAALVVPRRRAAVRAEQRGFGGQEQSSDEGEELEAPEEPEEQNGGDTYQPGLESEPDIDDVLAAATPGSIDDDGDEAAYQQRVYDWCVARWRARNPGLPADAEAPHAQLQEEPYLADPDTADHAIRAHDPGKPPLRVPRQIWARLLEYQRAGVRWMFTLHQQRAGGVLGDEMGLGKTVQTAAFLAALYHSKMLPHPSIIVCPATLMRQWVRELHAWWPVLRVAILHNTGVAMRSSARAAAGGLADLPPSSAPSDVWESARSVDPHFGGPDAELLLSGYDSSGDYEYDAYGSRIRRKRKPRGTLDWRKRMKQQRKQAKKRTSKVSQEGLARAQRLIEHVQEHGHVLVVTYTGLQMYSSLLLQHAWGYAVLDEGHMIRNPDADATLVCKQLNTRHRLLVTGTPIQNNLTELWSLFDFIFPGRLGTLPVFTNQFAVPITVGGFAGATPLQVRAAYQCACVLRDLIEPYLLRRLKADVARDLPQKSEHVVFCRLTRMQKSAYLGFLQSHDMERILGGRLQMLFGVDVARKICDHPDLLLLSTMSSAGATHRESRYIGRSAHHDGGSNSDVDVVGSDSEVDVVGQGSDSEVDVVGQGSDGDTDAVGQGQLPPNYGDWRKSGKMTIVRALLDMWKPQGHKVLIFSQTRQMLDILERMLSQMPDTQYRRMDGTTPIQHRTALVDEFNTDKDIFVFLLTTKVGGLGINLTGADRVILFSPDWNPSSDMQARERAWRLGQRRSVAIYRLMTAGTIEEKIYNRQIYKQFLSSKILDDPGQKRVFQSHTLQDLFSLSEFDASNSGGVQRRVVAPGAAAERGARVGEEPERELRVTETGRMFASAQLHPRPRSPRDVESQGIDRQRADRQSAEPQSADGGRIESIGGVVRLEPYTPATHSDDAQQPASEQPANGSADADEDRVLQSLFKMSGMHSALRHDAVMDSRGADSTAVIDQEAERIARDARMAVRESQRERRQVDVRVPTWTGASGRAGIPESGVAGGSRLVAPPPSAVLSPERVGGDLPGLQAVAKSRRKPLLASAAPTHGPSSSSLLAGLRAKSADTQTAGRVNVGSGARSSAAASAGSSRPRAVGNTMFAVNSRGTQAAAAARPSSRRTILQTPQPRSSRPSPRAPDRTHQRAPAAQPVLSERDRQVVSQIRRLLANNNGEVSNRALMDEFASEFPQHEQPRLKQLASAVADPVSRKAVADRTGIGRI